MAKKVILKGQVEANLLMIIERMIIDLRKLYGYWVNDGHYAADEVRTMKFFSHDKRPSVAEELLEVLDDKRLSLEKVMTELSLETGIFQQLPPFYGYPRKSDAPDFADSLPPLIELVAVTISKALEGPSCSKHMKLAQSLKAGDVVISFNYDILMDNALRNSGKLTDCGYLVPFQKASDGQKWMRSEDVPSEVVLLKLHGSMNWLRCSFCGSCSYFLMRSEKMGPSFVSLPKQCPACGESGAYLERVIIPPLLTKEYSDQPFNRLWNEASRRLSRTQEIVVIGYSFPPTDFATETLLRIGLYKVGDIQFRIVNPDKRVFERFSKAFGTSQVSWVGSLEEYLDTLT